MDDEMCPSDIEGMSRDFMYLLIFAFIALVLYASLAGPDGAVFGGAREKDEKLSRYADIMEKNGYSMDEYRALVE